MKPVFLIHDAAGIMECHTTCYECDGGQCPAKPAWNSPDNKDFPRLPPFNDESIKGVREVFDSLALVLGAAFFALGAALAALCTRSRTAESIRRFWQLMTAGAVWSVIAPLIYMWVTPVSITVTDAYLVSQRYVGWRHVAVAYGFFAGVLLGDIVGRLLRKPRAGS